MISNVKIRSGKIQEEKGIMKDEKKVSRRENGGPPIEKGQTD